MASGGPGYGGVMFVSALTAALVSVATVLGLQRVGIDVSGTVPGSPELSEVPPITGLPMASARELLDARRLTIVIESRRPDPERPMDTVVEQTPLAGSRVSIGSQVSVVISSGAPGATVPELLGVQLADARLMLEHAGLVVGVVTKTEQGEAGTVTAADPPPGSAATPGAAVALTVAEPLSVVPNVMGVHVSEARSRIEQAGLTVGPVREIYNARRKGYVVLEQTPAGKTKVPAGSQVSLVINQGD